jgi:hypothetical protein
MNSLIFVEHTDPEFSYAFCQFPDPVMRNETYCESLQYMGTVITPNDVIYHEFRHRAVPGTNERKYWRIPASPSFKERVKRGEFKAQCDKWAETNKALSKPIPPAPKTKESAYTEEVYRIRLGFF